jgi:hypothetical protein
MIDVNALKDDGARSSTVFDASKRSKLLYEQASSLASGCNGASEWAGLFVSRVLDPTSGRQSIRLYVHRSSGKGEIKL